VSYPEPRRIEISTVDVMGLTYLELARVSIVADVPQDRIVAALQRAIAGDASPAEGELGARVLYAIALQLERRIDRALTWADAETWRVVFTTASPRELEAEADAEIAAATISGAPVVERAGDLTLAHAAAYGRLHERARAKSPRGRR